MRESQNDIEAVAVYRFWTSPESVVKPSIADASAGQRSSSLVACMGPPPGASDGSGVGDAVGLFRWPEAPINLDKTKPRVRQSARGIVQRAVDHATRNCGDGVGGSERRKVGHVDVNIEVQSRCIV